MTSRNSVADNKTIGVLYGIRALMVILVCNFHIWQQSWLRQGFTVFGQFVSTDYITRSSYMFVDGMVLLSGFLLFLPHARRMASGTGIASTRDFYRSRALRILPSYLAVVGALLIIAINDGAYLSAGDMIKDVIMHITFTFNFSAETCLYTPLGPALWTVGVEVQFYILFPLLARWTRRKPAITLGLMAITGIGFRLATAYLFASDPMLINQLPAFLDVFALGFAGAIIYAYLEKQDIGKDKLKQALCAMLFALTVVLVLMLLREQSHQSSLGYEELRRSQLIIRLPFAVTLLTLMLSATFMPRAMRFLLDNRLMRFLAATSYGLYLCHQTVAVRLAKYTFPDTLHEDRNQQIIFTLLCFSLSVILSMLTTFGIEKPSVSLANKLRERFGRNNNERPETAQIKPSAD